MTHALFISVFVIAGCGLSYELIAGALASYLLGDSLFQFSTIIGTYLFAMGIGSYLSRYIVKNLIQRFIEVEILVGLIGGFSTTLLMLAYAQSLSFKFLLYFVVILTGTLVGLEIPLLLRILKDQINFRHLVSQVLTLDYIGALVVSIILPLFMVTNLGLVRSALIFGLANVSVGLLGIWLFRRDLFMTTYIKIFGVSAVILLISGIGFAGHIYSYSEERLYNDEIILAKSSPYQRIVLTRWKDDLRLFLNSQLQFSSRDEYRYHESLIFPALLSVKRPAEVLVLGGGDGLAVREILKDSRVEKITLVDLDQTMTDLFRTNSDLIKLNNGSLQNPKVTIINKDAFRWLDEQEKTFDFIVSDFPDPANYSLGKLYTTAFYRLLKKRLNPNGLIVVQATSPLFARKSFWCIEETMKASGFHTIPMHVYVPSFGEWGFVIGGLSDYKKPEISPLQYRFLTQETMTSLFSFPEDMKPIPVEINTLNNQILVHYYESEWAKIGE